MVTEGLVESLRAITLFGLVVAFAWVGAGAIFDQPSDASPAFSDASLCLHSLAPGKK